MAIEIERSTAPMLSRGFALALEILAPREAYLAHDVSETWPVSDRITAISLRELMRRLASR